MNGYVTHKQRRLGPFFISQQSHCGGTIKIRYSMERRVSETGTIGTVFDLEAQCNQGLPNKSQRKIELTKGCQSTV